jgi:nicotinamide-nucleotide amidase
MVCFGWVVEGAPARVATRHFAGDRAGVRSQSVVVALRGLLEMVGAPPSSP